MTWEKILKEELDRKLAIRLSILKDELPTMIMQLEKISDDYKNQKSFNTRQQRDYIGQTCYTMKVKLERLLKDMDGI